MSAVEFVTEHVIVPFKVVVMGSVVFGIVLLLEFGLHRLTQHYEPVWSGECALKDAPINNDGVYLTVRCRSEDVDTTNSALISAAILEGRKSFHCEQSVGRQSKSVRWSCSLKPAAE